MDANGYIISELGKPPNFVLEVASASTGFYRNDLPDHVVRSGLLDCEELSELLYALFWPAAPAR